MDNYKSLLTTDNRGFTLFQLIGVLVAVAIAATVALQVVQTSIAKSKYSNAELEMRQLGFAIVGNPDDPSDCGYIGDVGQLPKNLDDLITQPNNVCDKWNGPYVEVSSEDPDGAIMDPWGRKYGYKQGQLYVTSKGPQNVDTLITYNFANSYDQIMNNQMTITFNVPNKFPVIENGCDTVHFSKIAGSSNRWVANGLTQCPGDIFYVDSEGNKNFVKKDGDGGGRDDSDSGIIQYVNSPEAKKAKTKGNDNHIVDYTAEYTGSTSLPVRQMRISWTELGNYWGPFQPKLASASVGDSLLWDHGSGNRLSNGGVITYGTETPFTFQPGEMNFNSMVFQDVKMGQTYNVDMRATQFTVDYWPVNGAKQTITFQIDGYGVPGEIIYANNLVTGPADNDDSGDEDSGGALTDYFILADGDIDITGNWHDTEGNIHSNDDISIGGNTHSEFCGNITAVGTYSSSGQDPDLCGHTATGGASEVSLPSMGQPWTYSGIDETEYGNYTLSGDESYNDGDVVRISGGSLTIDDVNISGDVTFVVDGNVSITGDLLIGTGSNDDDDGNGKGKGKGKNDEDDDDEEYDGSEGEVIILAGGNVTMSGGNSHTVDAYIHADGAAQISGNGHTFMKLLWVDGSAQISGNSNQFGGGVWAGGSLSYTNTSGSVDGLLWSAGSMQIAASDHDIEGGIICGGALDISGSRLAGEYDDDNVESPVENGSDNENIVYDLDFNLQNPGEVTVYVNAVELMWDVSGTYLTEAVFNNTEFYNNSGDRIASGDRIDLTSAVEFAPGDIDVNYLHGFYDAASSGDHVDMAGANVDAIFYDLQGQTHQITIPVPSNGSDDDGGTVSDDDDNGKGGKGKGGDDDNGKGKGKGGDDDNGKGKGKGGGH